MTTLANHPDRQRLIEVAFSLKQTPLDSVHEQNVQHEHIWPTQQPCWQTSVLSQEDDACRMGSWRAYCG